MKSAPSTDTYSITDRNRGENYFGQYCCIVSFPYRHFIPLDFVSIDWLEMKAAANEKPESAAGVSEQYSTFIKNHLQDVLTVRGVKDVMHVTCRVLGSNLEPDQSRNKILPNASSSVRLCLDTVVQ